MEENWGEQLMRLASRIAVNRTVAGVHFPVDSAAGALLGLTLGNYLVSRCKGIAKYEAWEFNGKEYPDPKAVDGDFDWRELYHLATQRQTPTAYARSLEEQALDPAYQSDVLRYLWTKAQGEWT
jgi:hypothetical protein